MKALSLLLLVLCHGILCSAQQDGLSREAFINEILPEVTDSSLKTYYLLKDSPPCSFRKFDLEEWMNFGLKERVPVTILEELSKNIYEDSVRHRWDQAKLPGAVCIEMDQAKKILDPLLSLDKQHLTEVQQRRLKKRLLKEWLRKPLSQKMVLSISAPAFTDNHLYAVVDIVVQCDSNGCGSGRTFIFRRSDTRWEIAGERTAWSN